MKPCYHYSITVNIYKDYFSIFDMDYPNNLREMKLCIH